MSDTWTGQNEITTSGSGQTITWTFSFSDPEKVFSRLDRFAVWYWCRFVLSTSGERCLCMVGLGRVCGWLEDRACHPKRKAGR